MKKSRCTEPQTIQILKQAKAGVTTAESAGRERQAIPGHDLRKQALIAYGIQNLLRANSQIAIIIRYGLTLQEIRETLNLMSIWVSVGRHSSA